MSARLRPVLSRLAAAAALVAVSPWASAQPAAGLAGQWRSAAIENYGSHFALRSFSFTDREWSIVYRAYADAEGKQALFRLDVGGYYVLGPASARVSGALEGIFPALRRSITAESDGGVALFAAMGCSLAQGTPTALIGRGCGFVPSLMLAMGEYDLVSLKEGRLFLGDREGDLTKVRPGRLTPYALIRD